MDSSRLQTKNRQSITGNLQHNHTEESTTRNDYSPNLLHIYTYNLGRKTLPGSSQNTLLHYMTHSINLLFYFFLLLFHLHASFALQMLVLPTFAHPSIFSLSIFHPSFSPTFFSCFILLFIILSLCVVLLDVPLLLTILLDAL
jgi:hypothetical protein